MEALSKEPTCPDNIAAQVTYIEIYETLADIFNHELDNTRPLAVQAIKLTEDSRLYSYRSFSLNRYANSSIWKHFKLNFDQLYRRPRFEVDEMYEVATDMDKRENERIEKQKAEAGKPKSNLYIPPSLTDILENG